MKPVLFVTGAGLTPAQASSRNMETHASLLKWVQVMATPGASPVTSTRELESKCLKKERCALVMKAGPLEVGRAFSRLAFVFLAFSGNPSKQRMITKSRLSWCGENAPLFTTRLLGCGDRPLGIFPAFDAGSSKRFSSRQQRYTRVVKLTLSYILLYLHHHATRNRTM